MRRKKAKEDWSDGVMVYWNVGKFNPSLQYSITPVVYRATDHTRIAQPIKNANPPTGVMAPSQRIPNALKRYKLPEKITMPTRKAQPAAFTLLSGQREDAQATANSPSA